MSGAAEPQTPLPYAREVSTAATATLRSVWLVYGVVATAKHVAYWVALGWGNIGLLQGRDFRLVLIECVGYAIGWGGLGMSSLRSQLTALRTSAAVAGLAILITGLLHAWNYEQMALASSHKPGVSPASETLRALWSLLSSVQYAVVPAVVFVILGREQRRQTPPFKSN